MSPRRRCNVRSLHNGGAGSGNLAFSVIPDCRGDFNHNGDKEVHDIFDFLSAWFGAC